MQKIRQPLLFITVTLWAILIGGVVYSHIAFFPGYLSHLPQSNNLIKGDYGINDGKFWMFIHPPTLIFTILSLIANWKLKIRRKYILLPLSIYIIALIATFTYFVPELMAFFKIEPLASPSAELLQRGKNWLHLSWVRGLFIFTGFLMLLFSLSMDEK